MTKQIKLTTVQKKVLSMMQDGYVIELNAGGYMWLIKLNPLYLKGRCEYSERWLPTDKPTVRRGTFSFLEKNELVKGREIKPSEWFYELTKKGKQFLL